MLYHNHRPRRPVGEKEKARKRIIAATKSNLQHGQNLYRSFQVATNKSGPVITKPAKEQLDDIKTLDDIQRAVQELRDDSPLKAHKRAGNEEGFPETPPELRGPTGRRQTRRLGG